MKEVADVQMDFGMMGLPVNNAEIIAKYVSLGQVAIYVQAIIIV